MAPPGAHRPGWSSELPRLLGALLPPLVAGGVGGLATARSVATWYPTLRKPWFNPPDWVFGPVWSLLYLLMGIADYLVSRRPDERGVAGARRLYRLQLALNVLWSVLFFGRRAPLAALVEIVFLWVAIALTLRAFSRLSRVAALLLVPYLLWVSFAAVLTGAIWRLNRPAR